MNYAVTIQGWSEQGEILPIDFGGEMFLPIPDFKLTRFKAGEIVSNMGSRKKKRKKEENKFGLRYPV